MKFKNQFLLTVIYCFLATVLFGCTTMKEMAKGFAGVSTEVLEAKRKDAIKKSFALDYASCYKEVKELLKTKVTPVQNEAQVDD
ncbi:MAG: hypothetical protein PHU59_04685, partial [Candidatus Omnitrophica bacterium]|nr:hypothetical protein [Candidatus Omnitrophota bacterium]